MAIERSIRINVETGRAKAELRSLKGSLRETSVEARATATATRALTAAIAGVASIQSARALLTTADSYTNLQNKIRTVVDSSDELADVSSRLFEISQRSLAPIDATAKLYSKLALGTKELGASQEDLFRVVETVSKSVSLANDGAESAAEAITQLGQAFGGDFKAAAQEFNSILEQTPALAKAVADGLGVERNELKLLGEQGLLSSELIFNALRKVSGQVDSVFGRLTVTVDQSLIVLSNAFVRYVGEADKASGITAEIGKTIRDLASNFESVADGVLSVAVPAFEALALVIGARMVGALGAQSLATTKNIQTTLAHSAAIKQNSLVDVESATIKARQAALDVQLAKNRLANAIAIQRQTGSVVLANAAWTALAKTNQANIAAQNALTASLARQQVALSRTAALTRGLGSAMAFLGGPLGVALIAAYAITQLSNATSDLGSEQSRTKRTTDELAESFSKLGREQLGQKINEAKANLVGLREEQAKLFAESRSGALSIANKFALDGGVGSGISKEFKANTDARVRNNAEIAAAEAAIENLNNALGINSNENDENARNTQLVAAAYKKLRSEVDRAFKLEQDYLELKEKINKNLPDGAQKTELLRKAEQDYRKNLEQLNDKTRKAAERNAKLHRSYEDLRGEFEETSKIAFEYGEIIKEIANSTATDAEKKELQSLAYRKLQEDIDGATTTGQEFLAQFDQIAAAEVQRTESLKALEKVQASSAEKQKLAAEIQRQYNKDIDAATPSLIRLNAQFSAVDAATVAYVDTLKELDEAERKGLDVTNLRTSALKAYKKAAEEARKQDILNTETNKTFFGAFAQGLNDTAQTAESSFDKIREFGRETVDTLSTAFTEFVTTGEFNFKSFASNIIAELLRIQTQALILEGLDIFGEKRDSGGGFLESAAGAIGGVFGGEDKEGGGGIASFFGFGGGDKSTTGGGEEEPLRLGGLFDGGGDSGFGQESAEMFGETWTNTLDDVGGQFDEVFGNALAQSDQLGSSTESAAASIGTSLVSSLVKLGAQALINSTIGAAANAALVTAGSAAASALATAWAPAAAAASLATAGGNSIPAGAGISTIYGLTQTLSSGVGGAAGAGGATGGTFARGGVELSDLSGSVISTPTKFAAGGSFNNQLGEAGAEAILPLQKTAGGELGVKATMEGMQMQQAAPQVNVPVRVVNVARDPEDFLSSSEGEKVIVNIMNRNKGVFSA